MTYKTGKSKKRRNIPLLRSIQEGKIDVDGFNPSVEKLQYGRRTSIGALLYKGDMWLKTIRGA